MATSGSTLFELTRNQIIEAALRKLTVLAKGQSADTEDLTNGTQALNVVLARLMVVSGMPLWARKEYEFSPTTNTATYRIGDGQTLDTPFPLKIYQAILVDDDSDSQLEMDIISKYDYERLGNITSSGQPINLVYTPQVNYGDITLWPTPNSTAAANKTIRIIYQRPWEDFVAATDTPDFPKEWHQAVIYQLAVALAPEYGTPLPDRKALMEEAKMYLEEAISFGTDEVSVFFQPHGRY
jgi:hypothetical protein